MISINNAIQSTLIFDAIFFVAILLSLRIKKVGELFPISQSQELKGLAILLIVFSHIGYFLVADHSFLFPLTILAGVGVDLFLFLSGMGLTASALKKPLSIFNFYKKNLLKLLTPFWLSLIIFLSLDYLILKIAYSQQFVIKAFLGFFPSADLYRDLNSPLWYFTLILFYYLVFPLFFSKKRPWLSALFIYAVTYIILKQNFAVFSWVSYFYNLHIIAFPLGIFTGWLLSLPGLLNKLTDSKLYTRFKKYLPTIWRHALMILLIAIVYYLSFYMGGQKDLNKAQMVSIITMLAIIFLFLLKKTEFKLLQIFGLYSYEIYLLHWPILYRYDIFYKYLPAWLATVFYLIFFLAIAWIFKKLSEAVLNLVYKLTGYKA
jgi:peptidoglycan/LPS O-acetylase OafA/YrhL